MMAKLMVVSGSQVNLNLPWNLMVKDHVVIPDSKYLDLAQELTLSAWVNFQELEADAWKNLVRKEGACVVEITGQKKLQRMFGLEVTGKIVKRSVVPI